MEVIILLHYGTSIWKISHVIGDFMETLISQVVGLQALHNIDSENTRENLDISLYYS